MDISAISVGLSSIKTALDITKELRNIDLSLKDAEVKLKITELYESLSEAKMKLLEAREENEELKRKIKELEKKIDLKPDVVYRDGFYFIKEPKSGETEGLFCARCYSDEGKLFIVEEMPIGMQDFGKYKCSKCGNVSGR